LTLCSVKFADDGEEIDGGTPLVNAKRQPVSHNMASNVLSKNNKETQGTKCTAQMLKTAFSKKYTPGKNAKISKTSSSQRHVNRGAILQVSRMI
jgi:hypothetical protein